MPVPDRPAPARPTPRRTPWGGARLLAAGVLPVVLGAALLAPVPASQAEPGGTERPAPAPRTGSADGPSVHSSDGVVGLAARPLRRGTTAAQARRERVVTSDTSWEVVPGLTFRRWTWTDPRGPVRAQLLTYDLAQPGLALEHVAQPLVRGRAPLTTLLARDGAVAGVNGDFFDIDDTGAPLGVSRDRGEGLRSAPASGWTRSFWLDETGAPHVGELPLVASVRQHPGLRIGHLNSPTVRPGAVGIYRPSWGRTSGARVTDGQRTRVREVVVVGGRVRSNRPRLSSGQRIRGLVLVGRGAGAKALARLRPGSRVRVDWRLPQTAPVAISGSVVLLRDGVDLTRDDVQLHPRTAVGVDDDGGRLLFLVVDGRQADSRGLTMRELAAEMAALGAEQALNLDGGGSSTMVARRRNGSTGVVNAPSDGRQRAVPNGLGITYDPTAAPPTTTPPTTPTP
ncbi:phosphodiester glycosidase family protein [Nocardioides perillae]|uniref:Phosphodiester glycosidase domain-containing protein n=1 Tax=Nocardioides perillae TaxID=1119534 RepID=A0A7Y9UK65_9ACTN|nr:hypothetical protein [Nocardioides perillae]